jgi:hypothetical protein
MIMAVGLLFVGNVRYFIYGKDLKNQAAFQARTICYALG